MARQSPLQERHEDQLARFFLRVRRSNPELMLPIVSGIANQMDASF